MVRYLCAVFILVPQLLLFSREIKVTAEVDSGGYVGTDLQGTITVTHDESEKVDENSFTLDGKPVTTRFLKNVRISPDSPLVISFYNFTLKVEKSGLHILPKVSVKVGGKIYSSIPSSFEVKDPPAKREDRGEIILRLENVVKGSGTLYPGQRIVVGYRYIFNYSMELEEENVPLLTAEHFRKIGGKEIKEYLIGDLNAVEITQKIEADETGTFTFGPSEISARAYVTDNLGRRRYATGLSKAQAKSVVLRVLPLPEKDRPTSFNGAIGENFSFTTTLIAPEKLRVGEKITLVATVRGRGEIENLPPPEVCCQPGMSGFFLVDDLPPEERNIKDGKEFRIALRPLTDKTQEIPELEFSYFNPKEKRYVMLKSASIPLKVYEGIKKTKPVLPLGGSVSTEKERISTTKDIEIEGIRELDADDLRDLAFGTYRVFVIIPFGVLIILLQIQLHNYLMTVRSEDRENSLELFQKALEKSPESPDFFRALRKSLLLKLVEMGRIDSADIAAENLPRNGPEGRVRSFLLELEEWRYSGKRRLPDKNLIERAKKLFGELS